MPDRTWRTAGLDEASAAALLERWPASEVWSLLLEVMAHRAGQRGPADLARQWERDPFTQPSYIDQRAIVALDGHLFAAAGSFEAVELSPLAPLGSCSRMGLASQNKVVTALRGTEVVADPTNVLALECARRLRKNPAQVVRLATSHRCVRAQPVPPFPGFAQHFRMFCLATAGREWQDHGFLVESLVEHISTYVGALDRLEAHGYAFPGRRLTILTSPDRAGVGDRVAKALGHSSIVREPLRHRYYGGIRFMLNCRSADGDDIPLIDGGAFDWVGTLASNRRLAFVASGMGSQLVAFRFQRGTIAPG